MTCVQLRQHRVLRELCRRTVSIIYDLGNTTLKFEKFCAEHSLGHSIVGKLETVGLVLYQRRYNFFTVDAEAPLYTVGAIFPI